MDPRLLPKSDLYVFGGYLLLGLALLINPISLPIFERNGIIPPIPEQHFHETDIRLLLPAFVDLLWIVVGATMVFAPRRLGYYLNDSFAFNLFLFADLLAIMFSLNVIHPGMYKWARLLYLLLLLFFLMNTLFQAVVKKRNGREIHPFYRNLGVAVFGLITLMLLLEGIFMFHQSTHRFNGTLGSRSWFLHHWDLNADGYRDVEYDSATVAPKRKVLVIGDSFVAGHGVADPADRFSNQLQALIGKPEWQVFNLGVGGSDTRDENERLRKFPFKPDVIVFSWYPNDIEEDGERGGLTLAHARSYHDLPGPARYFARRSYLWNYLYWRFPHADELSDYFGYIQQCFKFLKVRTSHLREIDRLVAYGDSLGVPMVATVFPFLEAAEASAFATDPIEQRFRQRGVPTLSVRSILLGKPAIDYIVNQNDPHPNERLHKIVADSLFAMLQGIQAFSDSPLDWQEPITIDTLSDKPGDKGPNSNHKASDKGTTSKTSTKPTDKGSTSSTSTKPTDKGSSSNTSTKPTDKGSSSNTSTKPTDKGSSSNTSTKPTDKGSSSNTSTKPTDKGSSSNTSTKPTDKGSSSSTSTKPTDNGGTSTTGSSGSNSKPKKPKEPGVPENWMGSHKLKD